MFSKLRIVILGYIIRGPLGGLAWHHLQYMIGLHLMGHEVLFLEDSEDYASCYDPESNEITSDASYGLNFIRQVFEKHGMSGQWAYYDAHKNQWYGLSKKHVSDYCSAADVLLNISGVNPLREYLLQIPKRVLIDTDPVFTQIRHLTEKDSLKRAVQHTHFFSFGENFGKKFCTIPDDGFTWLPTRQPVVLREWLITESKIHSPWTTIMQWDSYKIREYEGVQYGMKSQSFSPYYNLPQSTNETFELAIGSATAPKEKLLLNGWQLKDPLIITKSTESYQAYINESKAEWSIAKQGYVISKSGWFSERSACYLASAKPVLVQDTGFSQNLETGKGLLCFTSFEECLSTIEAINSNYQKHCNWSREIATACFDSDIVLNDLLQRIS